MAAFDLDSLSAYLLAHWPSRDTEDELEDAGGEIRIEPLDTPLGRIECGFAADESGDTYGFALVPLPGHWTTDAGVYDEPLRLRFYGEDALPDP
jgi:hypothetical protein